ncbi:MAG: rhombosortase [Kangiellaceae bacterium]|jgi:rhomboid family GlyGly-CTERM serine protease|nr:rhombosortase [Kangiellaceae bacterium]|tara:strand:+ start:2196 stop:2780 length:585 start_codon:yes stop_codon:yes gene_type:complete
MKTLLRQFAIPITISLVAALIQAAPILHEHLIYQTNQLPKEAWRYLSANLVHTNWPHYLMNCCALLLLYDFFQGYDKPKAFVLAFILISLGNTFLLSLFPSIHWYVGMSGTLHGIIIWGTLIYLYPKAPKTASALLSVTLAKVGYEAWSDGQSISSTLIDARVVYEAHFTGILCGFFVAFIYYLMRRVYCSDNP